MPVKRTSIALAALATLTVAGAGVVASNAAITSTTGPSSVPSSAGTLQIDSDREGTGILDLSGLRPGTTRTGTVSVTSTGTRGAEDHAFGVSGTTGSPLAGVLRLAVDECDAPTSACPGAQERVPATPIETLRTAPPAALAALGSGATRHYRLTVTWPDELRDPDLQAATLPLSFDFTGSAGS